MQDRVPVNPGRVLITPENGGAAYYATMTRADNPTQEGTPLNKNTLLKDTTAALFGLGTSAVPDDVFSKIKTLINSANINANTKARIATGSYTGTNTYGASNPCSLTFDFVPKLVMLVSSRNYGFFISPSSECYSQYWTSIMWHACTWSGHTVSWYTTGGQNDMGSSNANADAQFNSGIVYYLAIG